MKRREFIVLLSGTAVMWPFAAEAQNQPPLNLAPSSRPPSPQGANAATNADDSAIGQIATLQGTATVTRGKAAAVALRVADSIFENDTLQTGVNSSLGVTFDDETTFNLSANTRIVVDNFVYQEGGSGNAASFSVASGTAAFVASLVAKTGDMKITTPDATLGIRGTTGLVDVPANGGAAAPTIKLYPDSDGHVGSIEVFNRQGGLLGALTAGASAFALRAGPGGRLAAVPYRIPPQEAARDRGVLQRLNVSHTIGRQMTIQRQQLRRANPQRRNNQLRQNNPLRPNNQPRQNNQLRPNNQRPPGGPANPRQPGGAQPFNRPGRGGNQGRRVPKNSNDKQR